MKTSGSKSASAYRFTVATRAGALCKKAVVRTYAKARGAGAREMMACGGLVTTDLGVGRGDRSSSRRVVSAFVVERRTSGHRGVGVGRRARCNAMQQCRQGQPCGVSRRKRRRAIKFLAHSHSLCALSSHVVVLKANHHCAV